MERRVILGTVLAVLIASGVAVAAPRDTELASVNGKGKPLDRRSGLTSISADGRFTAFTIDLGLQPGDILFESDVWMYDAERDRGERISGGPRNFDGNYDASVSGSGRFVAFVSDSALLVGRDTDSGPVQNRDDIFVYDRKRERTSWVSRDAGRHGRRALSPAISASGRFVAFVSSSENLPVPQSLDGKRYRVFVFDRKRKKTTLVSRTDEGEVPAEESAWEPSISADGRYVTYYSKAKDLAGGQDDKHLDVFRYDMETRDTVQVSVGGGPGKNGDSSNPAISGDGNVIAFSSEAADLVPGDGNGKGSDVFVRDVATGTTTIVSSPVPAVPAGGDGDAFSPSIAAGGRYVAFASSSGNLLGEDDNGEADVFRYDLEDGSLELVSSSADGTAGNGESLDPALSSDGRTVAFATEATDLARRDGKRADVLVRRLGP